MSGYQKKTANQAGPSGDGGATERTVQGNADRLEALDRVSPGMGKPTAFEAATGFEWYTAALDYFKNEAISTPDDAAPALSNGGARLMGTWGTDEIAIGVDFISADGSASNSLRTGLKGGAAHIGGSRGKMGADGNERSGGGGAVIKKDHIAGSIGGSSVGERDAEGNVVNGQSASMAFGQDGAAVDVSSTKAGKQTKVTLGAGKGGTTMGVTKTNAAGTSVNGSATVDDGVIGGAVGMGGKNGSASASLTVTNDKGVASLTAPGAGGVSGDAASLFGESAVSFGLKDGVAVGGSLGMKAGPVGVSIGAYTAESQTTHFHQTTAAVLESYDAAKMTELAEDLRDNGIQFANIDLKSLATMNEAGLQTLSKKHPKLYLAYLESKFEDKVKDARTFEELDIDGLQAGEAYSYETGTGSGVSGGASVYGLGVSLGVSDQNIEQLTVGKDKRGRTQVKLLSMDEEASKVGADLLGAVTIGSEEKKGNLTSVEFSVEDTEEGKRALQEFQATGLLPGAKDALAGDSDAAGLLNQLDETRAELEALEAKAALMTDSMWMENPEYKPTFGMADTQSKAITLGERREQIRAKITQQSGAINQAMLQKRNWDLSSIKVPGIDYTSHRIMDSESRANSLGVLGWEILSWGSSFAEWEEHYRSDEGDEVEYGGKKATDYVFADDERTHMVANPRNASKGGSEIELAMYVQQGMSKRERAILEALPNPGMRSEMMEAWAAGDFAGGDQARVTLAMTEHELGFMRDNFKVEEGFWGKAAAQSAAYATSAAHSDEAGLMRDMMQGMEKKRSGDFLDKFVDAEEERRRTVTFEDASPILQGEMQYNIGEVDSAEDFQELSENEQGIAIASYVMQAVDDDSMNPWDAAHMVLSIEDTKVRDRHMRTLFMTYEHASEETTAAVDFIEWVQIEGAASGLDPKQVDMLLAGAKVQIVDSRMEGETKQIKAKGLGDPKTADWVAGKLMGQAEDLELTDIQRQLSPQQSFMGTKTLDQQANEAGDWLQAADRAGGAKLVNDVLKKATAKKPGFVGDYLSNMGKVDRARARIIAEILVDTPDFSKEATWFLDNVQRSWFDQVLFDAGVPDPS